METAAVPLFPSDSRLVLWNCQPVLGMKVLPGNKSSAAAIQTIFLNMMLSVTTLGRLADARKSV